MEMQILEEWCRQSQVMDWRATDARGAVLFQCKQVPDSDDVISDSQEVCNCLGKVSLAIKMEKRCFPVLSRKRWCLRRRKSSLPP
jgi:hypothetical protein